MKLNGIFVVKDPQNNWMIQSVEEFADNESRTTPLGQLLIALVAEEVLSGYEISANFVSYEKPSPSLRINHPLFSRIPIRPLVIDEASGIVSVRGVEDALRELFRIAQKKIEVEISPLQEKMHDLYHASRNIDVSKAKAAIVAVYPEATDALYSSGISDGGLCCFVTINDNSERLFVAREIDHEFVGGIALIKIASLKWYQMDHRQRYDLFWGSLAQAFAVRELQIPEDQICLVLVAMREKPQATWTSDPRYDPYVVEQAMLETLNGPHVAVEFGSDNLPARVTLVPKALAA